MTKPKLHTPNLTAENIEKLAALFPNCVTEAKDEKTGQLKRAIDFDQLRLELSDHIVEGPRERYHLDWPGKREALLAANAPIAKTLRPCREESVDFDTTKNLFIEGDNLDALKLLQETYLGKVKMIYIDPPYNTGNDFLYRDDFSESAQDYFKRSNQKDEFGQRFYANTETNGRFHSDWLSMVYSRLKLARNLLSEDGVLFVSIDDTESENLKKVCTEIFGETNFIGTFTVVSTPNARDYGHIGKMHEYVHFFARNADTAVTNQLKVEDKSFRFSDEKGGFNVHPLYNSNEAFTPENRPNLFFPIYLHPDKPIGEVFYEISFNNNPNAVEIYPPKSEKNSVQFVWRWGRPKCAENFNKEIIGYKTDTGTYRIVQKLRHTTKLVRSVQDATSVSSRRGTAEVEEILGGKIASFPKPIQLIKTLVEVGSTDECLVMDIFAGSATTADAVIQLNSEDGGNRKFIMVQLPESCDETSEAFKAGYKTITEVGKERIRRAGKKISDGKYHEGWDKDIGFRVLKIDTSNMKDVYYAPGAVKQEQLDLYTDNIKEDRTPEDLLFQVLVDWGVDLALPIDQQTIDGKTVFFVDGNALAACFDPKINEGLVKELAKCKPLRAVFRDSSYDSDSTKINVEQIFKLLSPETEVKSL